MTNRIHQTARSLTALSFLLLALAACQAGGGNVAAVVDGYQITLDDLDRYYQS